jgi:aminoglycoside phosphotransferase (APT) family kinase protein
MTEIETEITAGLIRDLLRDQHPDPAALREVEGGWGNQMWRLGDELAVRIQRMDADPDHQLKERRWLPLLANACRCQSPSRCGVVRPPSVSPRSGRS